MLQHLMLNNSNEAAGQLAMLINQSLITRGKVLWLISGGSSIPIAVECMRQLRPPKSTQLWLTLVDDTYQADQNEGSNWRQLREHGFDFSRNQSRPIVSSNGDPEKLAANLAVWLEQKLDWADLTIGQFGLGDGYHTGGIQPHSIAAKENTQLAISYNDHGTWRLTITPAAIKRLRVAFINSFGENKKPLVRHFINSQATVFDEPTQALKLAQETYLCSDVLQ